MSGAPARSRRGMPRGRAGDEARTLAAERAFWLRSLDDLESELDAGEVDPDTYERLRDQYTARAADVLRRLEGHDPGSDPEPPSPSGRRPRDRRRARLVAALAVAGIAATALALGASLGDRAPGGTATGNDQIPGASTSPDAASPADLEAMIAADPDDVDARVAYARALLGSDPAAALEHYLVAADLDPTSAEARAYSGWLLVRTLAPDATDDERAAVVEAALDHLAAARAAAPAYPDAQVFSGLVLLDDAGDAEGALTHLQQYLALVPDGPLGAEVRAALERAVQAVRDRAAALGEVVASDPTDVEARLAHARALVPLEPTRALEEFAEAGRQAPQRPEPPAFRGWIAALAAQQSTDPAVREELTATALARLADAHALDPTYAPAWVFEGVVRLDLRDDPVGAAAAFGRALDLGAGEPLAGQAREGLARAEALAGGPR